MKNEMTIKEAAEYLGISEASFRMGRSRGSLKGFAPPRFAYRDNKPIFFKADLDDWQRTRQVVDSATIPPTVDAAGLPAHICEIMAVLKRESGASFELTNTELIIRY